eukprot:scaffold144_cov159-Skeletonema_menzelii.AAC.4
MAIKLHLKSARALKSKPVNEELVGDKVKIEQKDDADAVELKVHWHDKTETESDPAQYTDTGHKEENIASGSPSPKVEEDASPSLAHAEKEMKDDTSKSSTFLVDDHDDTGSTFSNFENLFNCWGAEVDYDDLSPSYMSCSTETQSTATEALDKELEKLQNEKEAATARKEQKKALIEAIKVEKAAAAEKERKLREIAQEKKEQEAAFPRKKQKKAAIEAAKAEKAAAEKAKKLREIAQKAADARARQHDAREAANAHYRQAVIQADKARKEAEMKDEKAAEVRRQMEKAKVAVKTTKMEAEWAKKIALKEVKESERALKELRVATKQRNAARQKYAKFNTAAAKKAAKMEAKKAAVTRKLVHKMEEEENQIRDAEDKIRNLRDMIEASHAYGMKSLIADDSDIDTAALTVSTMDDDSTIFPDPYLDDDMGKNLGTVLSDLVEEASILLTPGK